MKKQKIINEMFKSRKEALESFNKQNRLENLKEDIKKIDISNIDFEKRDNIKTMEIIEKSQEYVWTRIFLKDEIVIDPNDDLEFKYLPNNKSLIMKFVCYAKTGYEKQNESVENAAVNYNSEDNKKVLCVMINTNSLRINDKPQSMFRYSPYYQEDLFTINDIEIINKTKNSKVEFYDIDF